MSHFSMKRFLLLPALLLVATTTFAQVPGSERARFEDRRKSILDANELRATYHNYGFQGISNGANRDELAYEYPKNTNRRYIYFVSMFVGAEVNNQIPGSATPRFPVVVVPNFRTNPQTSTSWALNPIPGYFNPASSEIARSDRGPGSQLGNTWPASWPDKTGDATDPGWPDSWNGFFGKDIFNADQEFYYRAGDDLYARYLTNSERRFLPDTTDATRGGLGLIVDSRTMAWTQNLISRVNFAIYEIRNDSWFNYDKVSFMLWSADWVGTPSDDLPYFDQQRSTAFFTDTRPTQSPPEFDGTAIGVAGVRFLETPGNATDGIDNDGDMDYYIPGSPYYDARNADLVTPLTTAGGGFHADANTVSTVVLPTFVSSDFNTRNLIPGSPIVLIDDDGNRILTRYPATTTDVVTQGRVVTLPATGMTVREDTVANLHLNQWDDDFDGLIDENQPNHLTLSRVVQTPTGTAVQTRPVRFMNYLNPQFFNGILSFADRDTIRPGMSVPMSWVRDRMATDAAFRTRVTDTQQELKARYTGSIDVTQFDQYFLNANTSSAMIDESRDDFFDNNLDWRAGSDDVGLDGVETSGDTGEGDGIPTSGAFTNFPGESNIDKTDVRETDAIGITSATFRPAGGLNLQAGDDDVWRRNMIPGLFSNNTDASQDTDQFITSSFFPLRRGAIERFAVAVTIGQSNNPASPNRASIELVEAQLNQAFNAYDANYQFAIAPPPPVVKTVYTDGQVLLYWDTAAEEVYDRYLARLGANPFNFEGYRVYRSTDPALLDSRVVTDGRGTLSFLRPIAQFDKMNGVSGNHPIPINGTEYYLGDDSGLKRYFLDEDVIPGRTYYYAVVAYNSGAAIAGISPAESPINLSVNPDGTINAGVNVVKVIPRRMSAGYVGAESPAVTHTGPSTSNILVKVEDPSAIRVNNTYRMTIRDTSVTEAGTPVVTGGAYTLVNETSGETLVLNYPYYGSMDEQPVVEGFRIILPEDALTAPKLVADRWSDPATPASGSVRAHAGSDRGYAIVFGSGPGFGTAKEADFTDGGFRKRLPSQAVDFKVVDAATGADVPFAIQRHPNLDHSDRTGWASYYESQSGRTYSDQIYLLDGPDGAVSWQIGLEPHQPDSYFQAKAGDTLHVVQSARFTSADQFTFGMGTSNTVREDLTVAKSVLDSIRVVPNPYIVTHLAETRPTPVRPQQERQLHFTNLPARCTIRIFNVAGQLVQTLHVNNSVDNGLYVWNMLTKDNLDLSYGVYIYHVEAPGVGEKVGRFAVIK